MNGNIDNSETELPSCDDVNWKHLHFCDLQSAYDSAAECLYAPRASRYGDIMNYVESDKLWPPLPQFKEKIVPALQEVLSRLPAPEFDRVLEESVFLLEGPRGKEMLGISAPAPDISDSNKCPCPIAIFHHAWELNFTNLVGLIAHEIAHIFVHSNDYEEDEKKADQKVIDWGFGEELARLHEEQKQKWGRG